MEGENLKIAQLKHVKEHFTDKITYMGITKNIDVVIDGDYHSPKCLEDYKTYLRNQAHGDCLREWKEALTGKICIVCNKELTNADLEIAINDNGKITCNSCHDKAVSIENGHKAEGMRRGERYYKYPQLYGIKDADELNRRELITDIFLNNPEFRMVILQIVNDGVKK